jgi:prophage tail gpP-like protein
MPDQTESPLTIKWGTKTEAEQPRVIKAYSIDSQYLTSTDQFSITLFDTDKVRLSGLLLETVELSIYGEPVMAGRIERLERGADGRQVVAIGRDHISELVESSIDPEVKVDAKAKFERVIKDVCAPYGISAVVHQGQGDKEVGDRKPEPGQGVYDFLNQIAARLDCTIQPGLERNTLILDAPDYTTPPVSELYRSSDPTRQRRNSIISATSREDASRLPSVGLISGKVAAEGKPAGSASTEYDTAGAVSGVAPTLGAALDGRMVTGRVRPSAGRRDGLELYRLLYIKDDKARTEEQVTAAITRAVSDRLRESLEYQLVLFGHRWPGDLQQLVRVGDIVTVRDDVCDVEEPLWCSGRRFTYQRGGGSTTSATLWRLGSFLVGNGS